MNEEEGFLQHLLENPAEDSTRLVYADWLEERGDSPNAAKAEFLRLSMLPLKARKKAGIARRLRDLAEELDGEWLAVVSKLQIENCGVEPVENQLIVRVRSQFSFICDRSWEDLRTTDQPNVRSCVGCRKNVHYCASIEEARSRAENRECIALSLGVIRREGDLERPAVFMGYPATDFMNES